MQLTEFEDLQKAAFYDLMWNTASETMVMAQMMYDENGTPVDYVLLEVNPAFERNFCISKDEAVGRRPNELFSVSQRDWVKICGEAVSSGRPLTVELQAPDNKWFEVHIYPLDSENRFATVTQDITARKRTELALQENEKRFRLLIDTVAQAVWESDADGRTVTDSPSWRAYTGQTFEEWLGYGWANAIHPDDLDIARKEFREARESCRNISVEVRLRSPDGNWRWSHLLAAPIFDLSGSIVKWVGMNIDVSERKRAEEAQREQERLLRTIFDNSRDGIYMIDFATRKYISMSQSLTEITGFSMEERNSILANEPYERLHPGDISKVKEYHKMFAAGLDPVKECEYRWKVRNGEYRWFRDRCKMVRDDNGKPVAVVGISRDVTERKKLEQALQEKGQRFEALVHERTKELHQSNSRIDEILESITDAFYALDQEWRITYWNNAAEKLFGIKREEILQKIIWGQFPKLVGSEADIQFHKAMDEQKPVSFTSQGICAETRWFNTRAYPSPSGLTVYLQDITEQKLAENQLRESNDRFRKVFETNPIPAAIASNIDNRFIDVNRAWEKLTGYGREEVLGKTCKDLNLIVGDLSQIFAEIGERCVLEEVEFKMRRKSGEVRDVGILIVLIEFDGEPCRLTIGKDITEMIQYKSEMARLERLNMVGQMAASIAHEIRNPMTVVRGFLQMMSKKEKYFEDKKFLSLMIDELDRANSIISNFLSLASNKVIDLARVNLNDIICNLLPLIQADAMLHEISVRMTPGSLPSMLLDQNEVRQLILNLTRNACEAMEPGGVLSIRTAESNGKIILQIEDQGKGIPPEILEHIGMPFYSTKENGTGLGLAVCYSIANRLSAKIEIDTGTEGTTVSVIFDAEENEAMESA